MQHVDLAQRFEQLNIEVELGFTAEQTAREVQRCLNCDIETVFTAPRCIECDACIDVCPVQCLTIAANGEEADLRKRLSAPAINLDQALYVSAPLPQTGRLMVKDEDLCVHCGLCAERCPTAAWDMQKFELLIPLRGATAVPVATCMAAEHSRRPRSKRKRFRPQARQRQRNRIGQRQRPAHAGDLPHGHPGLRQESVPVEHSGPAHLVRDPRQQGRLHRARARLRPDGRDELADLRARRRARCARAATCCTIRPGRSTATCIRDDVTFLGVPLAQMCNDELPRSARAHPDEEHRLRRRAGRRARHRHGRDRAAARREVRRQEGAARIESAALRLGYDYAKRAFRLSAAVPSREDGRERRQDPDRRQHRHRARLRLRRRDGRGLVSRSRRRRRVMDAFKASARSSAATPKPGRTTTSSCRPRTSWPPSAW